VIGKGGENVSMIRKMSGAKCTVSDYQKGAVERILTVSGVVDAVAKVRTHFYSTTVPWLMFLRLLV
jgi:poly(rC)-binding protein 2/3/4